MRIISGKHKGRRFTAPKNLPVRPTTDRAKEALFNILYHQYNFEELTILDLFSGIGSISFEFASRGVPNLTAVDINRNCSSFIRTMSETLDFNINIQTQSALDYLSTAKEQYDIIFADPPYAYHDMQFSEIIDTVFNHEVLNNEGVLIVEHSKHTDLKSHPNYKNHRQYGNSVFSWFGKTK